MGGPANPDCGLFVWGLPPACGCGPCGRNGTTTAAVITGTASSSEVGVLRSAAYQAKEPRHGRRMAIRSQGQWRELLTVSGRRPPHVRAHQLARRPPGRQPGGTPGAAGLVGGVPGYGVGRLAACACPSGMARAGSVPTSYPDPARDVMICRLGATPQINSPGTRRRRVRGEACRGRGPESPPSPYGDARTSGDTAWPCKSTSGVSASGVSRPESCIPCCLMTW